MENICLNKDQAFMCRAIMQNGDVLDEYTMKEDGTLKETLVTDIIKEQNIKQFGLVGSGHYINFDTSTGVFDFIKNTLYVKLFNNEDNKDLLDISQLTKFICYYQNQQYFEKGELKDELVQYNIGYRFNNDNLFFQIKISLDKFKGWIMNVVITPKNNFNAEFQIIINDSVFARKEIEFKSNDKFELEIKIM